MARFSLTSPWARDAKRRREESTRRAMEVGPTSPLAGFNPLSQKDPWLVEWNKRRKVITDQYWRDKNRFRTRRRTAERKLQRDLENRKEDIDRYYRLHELADSDPRFKQAQRKAEIKFGAQARRQERKHRDAWQDNLRDLQLARDKQKRQVTKQMRREYRESSDQL